MHFTQVRSINVRNVSLSAHQVEGEFIFMLCKGEFDHFYRYIGTW